MAYSNAKPNVPALFKEIMRNDEERAAIRAKLSEMTQAEWARLKELGRERQDYRRAAERALHHNVDKGNLA